MTGKVFVDTNVLCYMYSTDEPVKSDLCLKLVDNLRNKGQLVWSTQVMQEFYHTLTKKFNIDPKDVKQILSRFSEFELVINYLETIERAIDIQILNKISFWDSLIISSAKQANCSYLLSEDLSHGQLIDGVRVVSPFKKMDF